MAKTSTAPRAESIIAKANAAGTQAGGQSVKNNKKWLAAELAEKASETLKLRLIFNHTKKSSITNANEFHSAVQPKLSVPSFCEVLYQPSKEEIEMAKEEAQKDSRNLRFTRPYTRYMIYMDGAESVWLDETDIDIKDIKSNPPKGILLWGDVVDIHKDDDPKKFEYLKYCSYNRSSPHKSNKHTACFEEINVQKVTAGHNKKESVKARMLADLFNLIDDTADDDLTAKERLSKLIAIGSTIKINGQYVLDLNKQDWQINNDLRWLVTNHPELWLRAMSNPVNLALYVIKQGIETHVLKFNAQTNGIYWANNQLIQSFPPSLDAQVELAALLISDGDTYQEIRTQVQQVWDERALGAPIPEPSAIDTLKCDDYYTKLAAKLAE